MNEQWATEHLQVIRTLMERSALYRRALAPIATYTGLMGLAGGLTGQLLKIEGAAAFAGLWLVVAILALVGSLLLVRRQAMRDSEPFWSPPTRRVAQALAPPLAAGALAGVAVVAADPAGAMQWLPPLWMVLFGCALSSAGFFMQRGIKLLGWLFVLLGASISAASWLSAGLNVPPHWVMAAAFGGIHIAYGVYLRFTENDGK